MTEVGQDHETNSVVGSQFKRISKMSWVIWGITGSIPVLLLILPVVVAAMTITSWQALAGLVVAAVLLVWWWFVAFRRWRSWGYAEFERDLHIRRGVLVHRLTIVPYGRMQFIDVRQGPLERAFGLATVKLHTAAAATDAEIPYLPFAEAERLRHRLTELGEAHAGGL